MTNIKVRGIEPEVVEDVWVVFYELNSGGYLRLGPQDWQSLRSAGWDVYGWDPGDGGEKHARKKYPTEELGILDWERVTGRSRFAPDSCDCCGEAFNFDVEDDTYWEG